MSDLLRELLCKFQVVDLRHCSEVFQIFVSRVRNENKLILVSKPDVGWLARLLCAEIPASWTEIMTIKVKDHGRPPVVGRFMQDSVAQILSFF